jgi:YidC/Oxa1 family membrane protein insertase
MFYGLRRMADAPVPGFIEGGFGWVTDLTLPDPYYILPITSAVLMNIVIRVRISLPS